MEEKKMTCPICCAAEGGTVQNVCDALRSIAPEQLPDDRGREARQIATLVRHGLTCDGAHPWDAAEKMQVVWDEEVAAASDAMAAKIALAAAPITEPTEYVPPSEAALRRIAERERRQSVFDAATEEPGQEEIQYWLTGVNTLDALRVAFLAANRRTNWAEADTQALLNALRDSGDRFVDYCDVNELFQPEPGDDPFPDVHPALTASERNPGLAAELRKW